ncbi:MAG: glycosyltransferase [Rhizobiaceae bacterium]|nr:glycosyltransferase [Rhizobiaceae bacterium]
MRIWLATVGEPLPVDDGSPRLLRSGQFAHWLAGHGHDVVFWTGTMDHYQRRLRSDTTTTYEVNPNYKIVALAGRHYDRTISYSRFRNHGDIARSFKAIAGDHEAPDVILASYPIEELCRELLNFAEPRGIPVVIDIRDFWPDIFSEMLPAPLRPLAPLAFYPLERAARRTLRRATAISGMTETAMGWGVAKAGREPHEADFWFPFSYRRSNVVHQTAAVEHDPAADGLRLCFLGSLSQRSNIEVLIDAFRLLNEHGVKARLSICGAGDAEAGLKARAADLPNVELLGWVGAAELHAVMRESDFGALPYDRADFHKSIPNKCVEYFAGGLPVLTCTEGEVRSLVENRNCGVWVPARPEELARAISELAGAPERLAELKRNVVKVFDDTFEENVVFEKAVRKLDEIARMSQSRVSDKGSTLP